MQTARETITDAVSWSRRGERFALTLNISQQAQYNAVLGVVRAVFDSPDCQPERQDASCRQWSSIAYCNATVALKSRLFKTQNSVLCPFPAALRWSLLPCM